MTVHSTTRWPLRAETTTSLEEIEPHREGWDRLAVGLNRPYCAPGWLLGWWRHARPPAGALRTVVVLEGDEVVGVAPLYAERGRSRLVRYGLLGSDVSSRVGPLARADRAGDVAATLAAALARLDPPPDLLRLRNVPEGSSWASLLASSWPGSRPPTIRLEQSVPAPVVTLPGDSFDAWLRGRSSNFRQQMRRYRRHLESHGATFRMTAGEQDLERDISSLIRLHTSRWDFRGGSAAIRPGVEAMLRAAGVALLSEGRFRLHLIEVDGRAISAHLFIGAGDGLSYWLGGFDGFRRQSPALVTVVDAIEKAFASGYARLDLGPGGQEYKYRLADDEERLDSVVLVPRTRRHALVRMLGAASRARDLMARRLPEWVKGPLRRGLHRGEATGPTSEAAAGEPAFGPRER